MVGVNSIVLDQYNSVPEYSFLRVKQKFPGVFKEGLGTMKGVEGKLYPDKSAVPKFFKARSVPYAMKDKVGEELLRLKEEGVIEIKYCIY